MSWPAEVYYDKQGYQITGAQWGALWESIEYRQVGKTVLADGTIVSTVWLGLSHGFVQGNPVLFETMVFSPLGESVETRRYCTEAEAQAGHAQAAAAWKLIVE